MAIDRRSMISMTVLAMAGASRGFAADKLLVGLAVPNLQADFFNQVKQSVTAAAQKYGNADVIVVDAQNDGAKQVGQVQDLITKKIRALIYTPAGATAASVPVKLARSAKIPVICVDRFPPGMPGDTYIASDSVKAARVLGEWVIKQSAGKAKVAVIHGQMGTTPEVERTKGFLEAMKTAPGMQIVAEQAADWDADKAFTVAQDMLQRHPEITVFFGECDTMAISAARAARVANLGHRVLSVGFDGDAAALKVLKSGGFDATMTQKVQAMGRLAFQSVLDALAGKTLPKATLLDAELTTKQNVDQFIAAHP
jgi:ribose transport system substrate-binding protein